MAKRKARSQTRSLTPNHGKSGIDLIPLHAGGVRHVDESYNFGLNLVLIRGLHEKL
jgi:hypothetical protein